MGGSSSKSQPSKSQPQPSRSQPQPYRSQPQPSRSQPPYDNDMLRQVLRKTEQLNNKVDGLSVTITELKKRLAEAQEEARRRKDPRLYKQLKEQAWNIFYESLTSFEFTDAINKKQGENHHMLIGNISAGKTSLINYACNLKLKVGMGETTASAMKACTNQDETINVWDSPGSNEDFSFYDIDTLKLFWSMDRIFIVYCDSLKTCPELVKSMHKIKPKSTFLVRSMCDRGQNNQSKTIQEELETDRSIIKGWGIDMPILATSSRKDRDYLDNQEFCDLLVGRN